MDNKILKVHSVNDYNAYIGAPVLHPFVSIVDYNELGRIRHSLNNYGVYALFLIDDGKYDLTYGIGRYHYEEGTLLCVAPGQIGGKTDTGEEIHVKGWALLFDPQLIRGTALEKRMPEYHFFSYNIGEALRMTEDERDTIVACFCMMRREMMDNRGDADLDRLLVSYVELVLEYCRRFYNRQFRTRSQDDNDTLKRFRALLDKYYNEGRQYRSGVPTVKYCARELFLSVNYFGDFVKQTTGESAGTAIRTYIMNLAKSKLIGGKNVSEVAYELGYDYPHHFTRIFKKHFDILPSEFRKQSMD